MRFEFPRCREGKDETSRFSTSINSRRAQTATLRWAPHRLPLFTSHAVCPVLSNRLRWVRGRRDSTTPPDLSRGDWGKRPIAEIEHEMDLGAAKKGKIVSSVSGLVSMKSTVSVSGFWMV